MEVLAMGMRVCHISTLYQPYFAGHAVYLEKSIFPEFKKRGIENILITANFNNLPSHEKNMDVEIYRVGIKKNSKKGNLVFSIKAICILFRHHRDYEVIHLHGFWDVYGIITIFSMIFKKKLVLHMTLIGYDDPIAVSGSHKFMKYRFKLLSRTDSFISISTPMSDRYRKSNLPLNKLQQIYQGVNTKLFSPASSKEEKELIRSKLGISVNDRIVLFVGAIIKRKGIDILIDAWRNIDKIVLGSHLILVGPDSFDGFDTEVGPLNAFCRQMKKIVSDEKLRVHYIGKSDEVHNYLKAADLLVLPSRREGFGNVIIEAMSSGLPIIITEMDGIAYDLINNNQEGFIIHNREELEQKVICLLNDPQKADKMGKMARERAIRIFDIDKICDKYIQLYKQ